MKRLLLSATLFILGINAFAQISHGGEPIEWEGKSNDFQFESTPVPDRQELSQEDAINDQYKDIPYRFGVEYEVDFDSDNNGNWTALEDGTRVWRLGVSAPGALTINFDFDVYQIPEGAEIFVYDPRQRQVVGSFTKANASKNSTLGVGLLSSDKIIIEYIEPAWVTEPGYLHINKVVYGYRSVLNGLGIEEKGPFGNSGPCNIDVNCADLGLYDIQKRSVAVIVNGGGVCSGALVNNTNEDLHPYFLTANHCLSGNPSNAENWVFYFNHEIPDCGGSDDDAPTDQSVSGSTVIARNAESDFALLELDSNVPASYNVCFSGWDATDSEAAVISAYGIHHPGGDVKKICFEEDAPYHDIGTAGFVNQTWYIDQWEEGVTEGGSSGSPLFNQSGNIIGQLAGGLAACAGPVNNGQFDYYGRMGVSWDFGSTPETRLSDWLDPSGTGQLILPNSCAGAAPEDDLTLGSFSTEQFLFCSLESIDESINVVNTGSNDITSFTLSLEINGTAQDNVEWNGNLGSFQSEMIELGSIQLVEGDNTISVEVVTVNGGEDSNENGNDQSNEYLATAFAGEISFTLQFDDFPEETSWRIVDENDNILYNGGGYPDGTESYQDVFCLPGGCYSFIINDSWGDGICCQQGEGFYLIEDDEGNVLVEGGEFGETAVEPFCVDGLGTRENAILSTISVYPNPAKSFVNIHLGDVQSLDGIVVSDLLGRTVYSEVGQNVNGEIIRLETSNFGAGVYLVQIKTEFGTASRKIIIE